MVKLTQLQRAQIAALYNEGKTYEEIMCKVGCSRSSVARWKNDLNVSKPFQEKKRSGRPKKISNKIEKKIIKQAKGKRKQSIRRIASNLKKKTS